LLVYLVEAKAVVTQMTHFPLQGLLLDGLSPIMSSVKLVLNFVQLLVEVQQFVNE
jgi:hypothetical protein